MKRIVCLMLLIVSAIQAFAEGYKIEEIEFYSHKTKLSGSMVFPKSGDIHAAVVFVHGSGRQTRNIQLAERFASEGIVALVYDKRGAGRSGGVYENNQSVSEKNITLLSDDSIAALNFLNEDPKTKNLSLGLTGISQARWIVPLAAEKTDIVDFVVLWSGPVCKVSEEDIFSKYTADMDGKKVPSYEESLKSRKEKYIWPNFLGKDSDPSESLEKLKIPGLWIFGQADGSVPVDLSIESLQKLIDSGHNYEYVLFSSLGHNNMDETFVTATDWIKRLSK